MAIDYKEKYFDEKFKSIDTNFREIAKDLKANTSLTREVKTQAEKTNGRVTKLEEEVFGKVKAKDLPNVWRDPKVISIVFNVSLAVLILVIAATKVDVGVLLP